MVVGPSYPNIRHDAQGNHSQHRTSRTPQQPGTSRRGRGPILPSILQWNVNGLRTRMSELRQFLSTKKVDILALQETNVTSGDVRLSPYVLIHSAAVNPNGRSRVALFVRASLHHASLDLSDLCSPSEEYAGVTVRIGRQETTVVSAYITSQGSWDPTTIEEICKRSRGNIIICGDFNAHNQQWGGSRTDTRGRKIEAMATALNLRIINDGSATFCRPGTTTSTIDITLVSPDIDAIWTTEPDTAGSDHFPINVVHPSASPRELKTCKVINWDLFRQNFASAMENNTHPNISA